MLTLIRKIQKNTVHYRRSPDNDNVMNKRILPDYTYRHKQLIFVFAWTRK